MMMSLLILFVLLLLSAGDVATAFTATTPSSTTVQRRFYRFHNSQGDFDSSPPTTTTTTVVKEVHIERRHQQLGDTIDSSSTNLTIQVPRFYPNEVKDGTYPSKLHFIHVQSLLSTDEAAMCIKLAQEHDQRTGCWNKPDFERHSTYATCDFAVEQCSELSGYLEDIGFHERLWQRLEDLYDVEQEDMTYLDFFCSNYRATAEKETDTTKPMDRLEAHRDGSILSFTVLLTPPDQFEGGGTFFDALRDVTSVDTASVLHRGGVIRPVHAGDVVFHSGKLLHGADVVTSGQRTVLVGFVDVADWCQRPHVLAKACRDFGRMDVATYHYKRQLERITTTSNNNDHNSLLLPGWFLRNARWLPDTQGTRGRSHIRGIAPVFPSTGRRADPEFQRLRKLEAEDVMLRTILLPEKDLSGEHFLLDDSVSIL